MFSTILSWFSYQQEVKGVKNLINGLLIAHKAAETKISRARTRFERTRSLAVKDFEKTKKATLEETEAAVTRLTTQADTEEKDIEESYVKAKQIVSDKRIITSRLHDEVMRVKSSDLTVA